MGMAATQAWPKRSGMIQWAATPKTANGMASATAWRREPSSMP